MKLNLHINDFATENILIAFVYALSVEYTTKKIVLYIVTFLQGTEEDVSQCCNPFHGISYGECVCI